MFIFRFAEVWKAVLTGHVAGIRGKSKCGTSSKHAVRIKCNRHRQENARELVLTLKLPVTIASRAPEHPKRARLFRHGIPKEPKGPSTPKTFDSFDPSPCQLQGTTSYHLVLQQFQIVSTSCDSTVVLRWLRSLRRFRIRLSTIPQDHQWPHKSRVGGSVIVVKLLAPRLSPSTEVLTSILARLLISLDVCSSSYT